MLEKQTTIKMQPRQILSYPLNKQPVQNKNHKQQNDDSKNI